MKELDAVRFLKTVVSDKCAVDAMRCVRIYSSTSGDARIQGVNGALALDMPSPVEGNVSVNGARFFAAMKACNDPDISITKKSMIIKQGSFRAVIPLSDVAAFPRATPDGQLRDVPVDLLGKIKMLRPFFGKSKPWMKGIAFTGGYMYATNGFAMVRIESGLDEDLRATIPEDTVTELARLNTPIVAMRVSEYSCTFKLGEDAWLRSSLIAAEIPDLERILKGDADTPMPAGLREAVETVAPFCDGVYPTVLFGPEGVAAQGTTEARVDSIELPTAQFRLDALTPVLNIATRIDIRDAPDITTFGGDGMIGAVMGVSLSRA